MAVGVEGNVRNGSGMSGIDQEELVENWPFLTQDGSAGPRGCENTLADRVSSLAARKKYFIPPKRAKFMDMRSI